MKTVKIIYCWTKTHILKMFIWNGRKNDITPQDVIRGIKAKKPEYETNTKHNLGSRNDGLRG